MNGRVVGFRVNNGSGTSPLSFRVIRPFAGGLFSGAGTSGQVTPPVNQISPLLPVHLPISIGDGIGLECCQGGANYVVRGGLVDTVERRTWGTLAHPPLTDGAAPTAPDAITIGQELMLNEAGIQREIVLLDAVDEEALRRTHRRYFVDLGEILR